MLNVELLDIGMAFEETQLSVSIEERGTVSNASERSPARARCTAGNTGAPNISQTASPTHPGSMISRNCAQENSDGNCFCNRLASSNRAGIVHGSSRRGVWTGELMSVLNKACSPPPCITQPLGEVGARQGRRFARSRSLGLPGTCSFIPTFLDACECSTPPT